MLASYCSHVYMLCELITIFSQEATFVMLKGVETGIMIHTSWYSVALQSLA